MRIELAFAALLLVAAPGPASGGVDWSARFREIRDDGGVEAWYRDATNEGGTLAWGESYVLEALLAHYVGSGDERSLDVLVRRGDRVLAVRDDRRGVKDVFRDEIVAGWSSTKYSNGKAYVWAVHSGMLLLPLAEFCRLVDERPGLRERFGKTADRWRPRILESLSVFDGQWRDGPGEDEGHLVGLALGGAVLPFNQMNALGRVYLETSRWRDPPPRSADRAWRLLRFFRNRLTLVRGGDAYDWSYAAVRGRGEDISHAAINVDFAARGAQAGAVFTKRDMTRFARAFLSVVRKSDGWAGTVSGSGQNRYVTAIPGWLGLAAWDRGVFEAIEAWTKGRLVDGKLPASALHLRASGLLCRFREAQIESRPRR